MSKAWHEHSGWREALDGARRLNETTCDAIWKLAGSLPVRGTPTPDALASVADLLELWFLERDLSPEAVSPLAFARLRAELRGAREPSRRAGSSASMR